MRASHWFMPTLKEVPHDAEIISHQYMLRAGLIRKLGSGLYTWLPMGLRVLRRIETIVREEMNRTGALELLMPAIQPAELWQETGRWETFGGQLLTMQDSSQRAYCFGPTHEEVITDLIRQELKSYKQLPLSLYQIQTKFRDEIRPRFGIMRAREFIMKDAYSFHLTEHCLGETYQKMYDAYAAILHRIGLKFRAVEADTGAIGGAVSHEFQVLADSGEDILCYSDSSLYAANIEQATSLAPSLPTALPQDKLTRIETPQQKTITDVATFLNIPIEHTVKTLLVEGQEHALIALVLRGQDTLNEIKASKHPWIKSPLKFASDDLIQKTLGIEVGFLGPVNLNIPIIVDAYARALPSFVCGANQNHHHYQHAQWVRDTTITEIADLRQVQAGDLSPDGQGKLQLCRGIEVGHIFQLGSKYAEAMSAKVTNESGQLQTLLMGCYGIGVSRLVAAAIEQHHDSKGIIWPASIAPFQLSLIPIGFHRSEKTQQFCLSLYENLTQLGIDVLLDDRDERPGVLFADHELIGIPHRIVISDQLLEVGQVEYKARESQEVMLIAQDTVTDFMQKMCVPGLNPPVY